MKKRNFGQLMLIVAVIMILISGASIWFNWFDKKITSAAYVIALILIGAGAYLSKRNNKK